MLIVVRSLELVAKYIEVVTQLPDLAFQPIGASVLVVRLPLTVCLITTKPLGRFADSVSQFVHIDFMKSIGCLRQMVGRLLQYVMPAFRGISGCSLVVRTFRFLDLLLDVTHLVF